MCTHKSAARRSARFLGMAERAAETVRNVLAGFPGVPDEVRDYAADTAAGLLDDMKVSSCLPDAFLEFEYSLQDDV